METSRFYVNSIELSGNLVADSTYRSFSEDKGVCKFKIAQSQSYLDSDGKRIETPTVFIEVVIIGKNAPDVDAMMLKKGDRVIVKGKLDMEAWNHEGKDYSKLVIKAFTADNIEIYERAEDRRAAKATNGKASGKINPPTPDHVAADNSDDGLPF